MRIVSVGALSRIVRFRLTTLERSCFWSTLRELYSNCPLANLRFPVTPEESITLAEQAVEEAAAGGARIVCFPECFVPGYRIGKPVPVPDQAFLEHAWSRVGAAAAKGNITANCASPGSPTTSAVIRPDGVVLTYQPYGQEGLLIADIDLSAATGLLAKRYKDPSRPPDDGHVIIRTFNESDTPGVIELWRSVAAGDAPHNDPAIAIRQKLAVDRDLFLVAELGGAVVGTVMGGYDGHRGWLYAVAVRSDCRRRQSGARWSARSIFKCSLPIATR